MNSKIIFVLFLVAAYILSGCSTGTQNDGNNTKTSGQELTIVNEQTQIEPAELTKDHEATKEQDTTNGQNSTNTGDSANETDLVKEQISEMTLEEKIGQMFIVGFKGYEVHESIQTMLQKYHVGGVILFGNNIKSADQLLQLVNSLKDIHTENELPLFISVDEEGGRISRMPPQLHKLPSSESIGEVNNSEFSYNIGNVIAEEIKTFGFNMDFAPVLDIFSNPKNTVIGDRAFGKDAETVSKLGVQTMKGIKAGGIIPVVKHFPGHGDTQVDSHVGLPSVSYDMERLKSFEFVPFKTAIDSQADAVMISHILLERIDPENPASLSKTVITDLLREQMNFDGVVITDDMTMGAIEKNYIISDAVVKSVNAGSDIILVCHGYDNQVNVMDTLKVAVENGSVSEERIDESVCRVLKLKIKYGLTDDKTPSINIEEINKKIDAVLSKWYNR